MIGAGRTRSSAARSLDFALLLQGASLLLLTAAVAALLIAEPSAPVWILLLFPATAAVYAGAGLIAWRRRPGNRMGPIMIVGALAWLTAGMINTGVPPLVAAGAIAATSVVGVVVHLLLAFPSGQVRGRVARTCVVAAYVITFALQAPLYLFAPTPGSADLLLVADRPELAALGDSVQSTAGAVVIVLTALVLLRRFLAADRRSRRVLGPLLLYGILTVLFVSFAGKVLEPVLGMSPVLRATLQILALAGIPVAFAVALVVGGFRQTAAIEDLAIWLAGAQGSRAGLVRALADALGDPSLDVVFWAPEQRTYLDADGHAAALPAPGGSRAAEPIELGTRRVGAVRYDSTLIADPELVRRAGRVVAIAVDHERLTAEVRASEETVRQSRARIASAALAERRRIARDLHDGLQVKLVVLALEAYAVGESATATPEIRDRATRLRADLDGAAAELRDLVHGLMPALLIERGLYAAAEELVDRIPIPTTLALSGDDHELPEAVQSAAWFALSEGLGNAVRHSGASRVQVELARRDGRLRIDISDDGVGGAETRNGGTGLRGLADRVDVVSGRWRVTSPPAQGTRLEVDLPCGS